MELVLRAACFVHYGIVLDVTELFWALRICFAELFLCAAEFFLCTAELFWARQNCFVELFCALRN